MVGASVTLWALAPGHARQRLTNVALAAESLTIEMQPSEPVRLRFTTDTGRVLHSTEVRARFGGAIGTFEIVADDAIRGGDVSRMLRLTFGPAVDWHTSVAVADDGAALRLAEGLSKGRWRLFVRRPNATPWLSEPFTIADAGAATVTVPLPEAPRTRRVHLVADDTKQPLAGAALVPWYEVGDERAFLRGAAVLADEQGLAAIPYDPPDARGGRRAPTWWVTSPGRVGMIPPSRLDDANATEPIDVPVARSVAVEGEAYLPSGAPATGRRVVTTGKGMTWYAVVDADGRFQIEDVPSRDGFVEVMLLVDDTFAQTRAPIGGDGVAHAILGAKAAPGTRGTITGRLTAGGAPVAGAFVVDEPRDAKGSFVRTGADGKFVLEGLDVGVEHELAVYPSDPAADDSAYRIRTKTAMHLDAAKPLEFSFDLPAGVVRVKVIDADTGEAVGAASVIGVPVEVASERARYPGFDFGAGWASFTDEEGNAVLRGLLPGASHDVHVRADGYEPAERGSVVPGTLAAPSDLEIRVKKR